MFGGNAVVKPVSWTLPSTHSAWVNAVRVERAERGQPDGGRAAAGRRRRRGRVGGGVRAAATAGRVRLDLRHAEGVAQAVGKSRGARARGWG